ncbi:MULTISPECIES: NAD(P)H-hydrate dehydratase [unclassified Campylobacter]|uniref:NAD(P)H-hydrate dehydratase n=1 Tax=unclassified Campylobacter TaxID=2593542 RepID=UPI003D332BED
MKKLFLNTKKLDERAINLGLSDEILIENAANALAKHICKRIKKGSKILAIAGKGNNAADAIATLRILAKKYKCEVYLHFDELNDMSKFQLNAAQNFGVKISKDLSTAIKDAKCIIDGLFGSGLNKSLNQKEAEIINRLNHFKSYKIACDIPSGLNESGQILGACFKADATITMGAPKLGLYSDLAKDFVGHIKVADLGISRANFEGTADGYLLTKKELKLPFRTRKNTNKGDFGHAAFINGTFNGACELAALAASGIGAGLVSVISQRSLALDASIMQTTKITSKMNVVALGMGLCENNINNIDFKSLKNKKLVLDASLCRSDKIFDILNKECVLTPHPAEFCSLLSMANIANLSIKQLQNERFKYAKIWSKKFKCVLVLKGANTIIAKNGRLFIMAKGNSSLAKGGSGDVLSGLIAGLLAQGFSPLRAAITATLAHAQAARNFKANSYALTPNDIIKGIKWLKNA